VFVFAQDFRLTEMAANEGRAVVIVVNKWDQVDTRLWTEERYIEDVKGQLRHVGWATVVCTSAHKGKQCLITTSLLIKP
jgi:GTP-binding protein